MSFDRESLQQVLEHWVTQTALRTARVSEIAGGLSGARLWRLQCDDHELCLRRWPKVHPSSAELQELHSFISHVWSEGLRIVPLPQHTFARQSYLSHDGYLWELTPWLPGDIPAVLTREQTTAALTTLANFHQVAATFTSLQSGHSPGLLKRIAILTELSAGGVGQLERTVQNATRRPVRDHAQDMLEEVKRALATSIPLVTDAASQFYPLQWCLRDIHRGNLLFANDHVTGLVDFGAASIDSVAGDIARLVGSIAGDDPQIWPTCSQDISRKAFTYS